jgi:methylphosphotriester-DNA--protein-cysteine methyltransferase
MKIIKIIAVAVLLLFAAATVFSASADTVVYVTKTGTKYHKGSCSSLSKSKIETSLGSAVSRGYAPCSRCKPPVLDE